MPNWKDPEIKERLYQAIMKVCEVKVPQSQHEAIAAYFEDCTARAVTHQVQAINKEITAMGTDMPAAADGEDGDIASSPPKKTKKRAAPKQKEDKPEKEKPAKKAKKDTKEPKEPKVKKTAVKKSPKEETTPVESEEE